MKRILRGLCCAGLLVMVGSLARAATNQCPYPETGGSLDPAVCDVTVYYADDGNSAGGGDDVCQEYYGLEATDITAWDAGDGGGTVCAVYPGRRHRIDERKAAANFSLLDSNGVQVALADYKGKVVLLNFWATWCGPCKLEIPWFIEFNKIYKDRGFAVLGVSLDEDGWKSVKPYLAEKGMDYPVMIGNGQVVQSYGGIDSLPTTFIIDRDGRVAFIHMGSAREDTYGREIRSLLSGGQPAAANSKDSVQ